MKLSERMRKRAAVNMPIGGQRLYGWIEEVAQLEAESERVIELLIGWLKSDDDVDVTIHTDRWLRNKCNCENELPPCKICYALEGE